MQKDLGMMPYKVQLVQELIPIEHPLLFASLSWPAIDLQKMRILAKKSSFQMKVILILAGVSKIVAFEAQKNRRTHNESLFGADFGPEA